MPVTAVTVSGHFLFSSPNADEPQPQNNVMKTVLQNRSYRVLLIFISN